MKSQPERYTKARNITLLGAIVNGIQGILKLIFGWLGQSHALIADGVHSFADLLTDILVIFAAHYGSHAADKEHPYGHGRIETAATVALAVLIILTGLGIMFEAGEHFLTAMPLEIPHVYTLLIALLSAAANEIIFRLTLKQAKSLSHQLLEANAWHHRSDAASSAIVIVGIGGTLFGFVYLDSIAAFIVGGIIIKMGWDLAWLNMQELVDTGLDEAILNEIKNTIRDVEGVQALHQLRTRSMAGSILIDVHILVDARLSVSEGHHIATRVDTALMQKFKNIVDITVHVDPENDEMSAPSCSLPSRAALKELLESHWKTQKGYTEILALNIHYLSGKLILEVILPLSILSTPEESRELQQAYAAAIKDIEGIDEICLLFR